MCYFFPFEWTAFKVEADVFIDGDKSKKKEGPECKWKQRTYLGNNHRKGELHV